MGAYEVEAVFNSSVSEQLGHSYLLYSFPLLSKELDVYAYEYCLSPQKH